MEYEPPTIVTWHDGRDVYVYPDGDRFYVDEVRAMLAGAEERLKQPLKVDDLDELRARLERLKAQREEEHGQDARTQGLVRRLLHLL